MSPLYKNKLALLVCVTCICVLVFKLKESFGTRLQRKSKTNTAETDHSDTAWTLQRFPYESASSSETSTDASSHQLAKADSKAPGLLKQLKGRFLKRSRLLSQMCLLPRHKEATMRNNVEVNFWKSPNGKLKLCLITKIGSSLSKDFLSRLNFSKQDSDLELKTQKSHILVREPYSRLMSGYIDKIVLSEKFRKKYGALIISKFRSGASEESIKCGNRATFPEFVKYLIYSQSASKDLDIHFQPIHQHCQLCRHHYDFIGHLETLSDDLSFIMRSVNINVDDFDFDTSESTIRGLCKKTVRMRPRIKTCQDMCSMMKTVWWSFQARGLISRDIKLPVHGTDCYTISEDNFAELAMRAHRKSQGKTASSEQKRSFLVELFTQVPLQDRLRLREVFLADFELFGYDSMPPDLFPEIHQNKENSS